MKKFILTLFLAFSFNATAQSLVPPQSMANTMPPIQVQQPKAQPNAEAQGYSIAFLAYHYNEACGLGLSREMIDNLAGELKKAEQSNQITPQTINDNVNNAQKIYAENPTKFCEDARRMAGVIKQLFGMGGN